MAAAPADAVAAALVAAQAHEAAGAASQLAAAAAAAAPFTEEAAHAVQVGYRGTAEAVEAALAERRAARTAPCAEAPVRLVCASKTKPVAALMAAYAAGARAFGENYVQELIAKAPLLPPDIEWHLIGHLQSNKADEVVLKTPGLAVIETLDSAKLATKLDKAVEKSARAARPLVVFMQVNTSGEDTKSGVEPGSDDLLAIPRHVRDHCPHLRFGGLMTIGMPDYTSKPENFECLAACRRRIAADLGVPETSLELSMGMSGDFLAAVRMGSTNVRVGSAIFGARGTPHPPAVPPQANAAP
jgi:pyridoxal phosphate enzyme (YggS family)